MVARAASIMMIASLCGAQAPDAAEQLAIIHQVRANALAYTKALPNFICTQVTKRFVDYTGAGDTWKRLDTVEEQLTYFDGRERYKILRVNGKAPNANGAGQGVTSSGEFGSTLRDIFNPSSGTAFTWERLDELRGRQTDVFSFRVDRTHSAAVLNVSGVATVVGYRGSVYTDRAGKTVMRITTEADSPDDSPLQNVTHLLDYGHALIGREDFVLPLHGELRLRMPEQLLRDSQRRLKARMIAIRNEVDFSNYQKYAADSKIRFDPAAKNE
jgi:hypothetical protein